MNTKSKQEDADPISPEFATALRAFIAGLRARNGGFAKVRFELELDIARGEIRRFEGGYEADFGGHQVHVSEPYLMSAV